jgi:hypothetical protein
VFLGPRHLKRLPLTKLRKAKVFARVEDLGHDRALVALSDDPPDCLTQDFGALLGEARKVLAPILMVRD